MRSRPHRDAGDVHSPRLHDGRSDAAFASAPQQSLWLTDHDQRPFPPGLLPMRHSKEWRYGEAPKHMASSLWSVLFEFTHAQGLPLSPLSNISAAFIPIGIGLCFTVSLAGQGSFTLGALPN